MNMNMNMDVDVRDLNINKIGYNKLQIVRMPLAEVLNEIKEQTIDMEKDEVDELQLDQFDLEGRIEDKLKKELENYKNLQFLALNDCKLKSLAGFPNLTKLVRLELIDNHLNSQELKHLAHLKNLQFLFIAGKDNQISKVEDLEPLKNMEELTQLDIQGTELSQKPNYLKDVFAYLPKIEVITGYLYYGWIFYRYHVLHIIMFIIICNVL